MLKITSSVKTGGLLLFLLVFTLSFITASTENLAGLTVTTDENVDVTCYNLSDGSISVSITGGDGNYNYSWSGPGTFSASTEDLANIPAGTYTLNVTDNSGNSGSTSLVISQPEPLTATNPTFTQVSCKGGNDGTITAGTPSGGNGNYTFSIDGINFQASASFSGLSKGNYNITIKDAKDCSITQNIQVTEPDPLTATNPTFTQVSCNGGNDGTITAGTPSGGNGNYTFSIDGINFQASASFSGLSKGNYNITIKDAKDCSITQNIQVTEPDPLTATNPTFTQVSCNGGNDGTITAGTPSGGNGNYTFSIDGINFQASASFSGLSKGNYNITIKDAKDCSITQNIQVTEPEPLSMAAASSTNESCNGGADGSITAGSVSGGNGSYLYKLNNGNYVTSNKFENLDIGTYTITVKDDKGCELTSEPIEITGPEKLTADVTSTNISCFGVNDGNIEITNPQGGYGSFEYSIDNGATWQASGSFSNLSPGNYRIIVRDATFTFCKIILEDDLVITQPDALAITSATVNPVSCNGGNDGSIIAGTPSGGNGNYLYALEDGTFGTTTEFNNLKAGTYTLKIKDSKACELSQQIEITEPAALSMTNASNTNVTCFEGTDGSITAGTVSGGTAPYLYSLDNTNFVSGTSFTGLSAGDYTIFVKDQNDCALQESISVIQPDILNAEISKVDVSCFQGADGSIQLSQPTGGSGSYEFSIDGTTNWQSTSSFSNLEAGDYPIYIRDAVNINCELLVDTIQITEPANPLSLTISSTRTNSFGSSTGSATANGSGGTPGYTYAWTETGNSAVIQTTKTANNLPAGTYTLTLTDIKGCTITETVQIIDALEATIASRSICEDVENEEAIRTSFFEVNGQTAYGGVAPYSYSWNFGTGATNPTRTGVGEHTVNYSSTGNKTIILTVTDSTGESITITQQNYVGNCYEPCGKSENFVFNPDNIYIGDVNGNPVNITTINNCTNTVDKYIFIQIDKSANAYNPYIELIYKVSNSINNTSSVEFSSGCRQGDDIDDDPNDNKENKIGEFIKLTLDPINFNCGDNLDIENFYITWTNVSHKKCGQNNNAFCYSSNEPVIVPTPLSVEATPKDVLCKGNSTGTISTQVSGGYAPYSYNLSGHNDDYQDSKTFNNLIAGSYTVYVRDSRNNTSESNVVIIEEPLENIELTTSVTNPECFGGFGTATVTANGGTPTSTGTYEYLWNDPTEQTNATATNLSPGDYTVTVIDANGCQEITSVTITEPAELTIPDAGKDQNLGCGNFTTNLNANVPTQGTGTWSIDTGNSTSGGSISDPNEPTSGFTGPQGSFTLIWTIANADGTCAKTDATIITLGGECSALDFDGIDDHIYFDNNYGFTTGSYSIEVWVKPENVSGIQTILSKRDKTNLTSGGYDLIINNGAPTFRWNGKNVTTSSKLSTSRWYHIAVIFSGSTVSLYVDGIEVGNSSGSNPASITAPFMMGAMYDSATPKTQKNYFSGWMEELRLWNTALTQEQLRFIMNQRIEASGTNTKGQVLPMEVPGQLAWGSLAGYYHLNPAETVNGVTLDISGSPVNGLLKNIQTNQRISAPLPYISENSGSWRERSTWDANIGNDQEKWWDVPNGVGINGNLINWNIVETLHNINSSSQDIYLLGLISKSQELKIDGNVPNETGQGITITNYLKLDGTMNLEGNSQLVQTEGSILDETSIGYIDIDQQGTANSFNYNYWTSPVSLKGTSINSGFKIKDVLLNGEDGTTLDFNYQYHWADNYNSEKKRISTYWLYTFKGNANDYSEWHQFAETDLLDAGIGYSMKGTTGYVPVSNKQNYTFRGKPNNGNINVSIGGSGQNLLTGNPYPSAIDAQKFIGDNLSGFNGSLYFWDHFGPVNSHYLEEYVGGYAVYNLSGGIASASSVDSRINPTGETSEKVPPGRYIPVGQAFFVSSTGVSNPTQITYRNRYRAFVLESTNDSQFHSQEKADPKKEQIKYATDSRFKIRLTFESPKGYHRQILVTADANTSNGFDLGYDAPLIENNIEDMYWMIDDTEFVIQGVPNFNLDQVLPIGIKISEEGEYTIKIDELENIKTEFNIYLKDNLNDTFTNLNKEDYTTTADEPGYFNERYEIVFRKPVAEKPIEEIPEELEEPQLGLNYLRDTDEIAVLNPDMITVDHVELYSISGQLIKSFNEVPTERSILLSIDQKLSSAVYIVRMYSGEKYYSRKVIITK